jgi:hypothetical protein
MRWLKRRLRRRPKRGSKLDRQLHLGLLQEAMGRAERPKDHPARARKTGESQTRMYPAGVGGATWFGGPGR